MQFLGALTQAAREAETVTAEPTNIVGMGEVLGIVDRMSADKMLKKGMFGGAGQGTITVVYRRSLFTDAQIKKLNSASVSIPSHNLVGLAISNVDVDDVWVTILADLR